eukprot:1161123-Pelagomonas_calceolata.AAC.6
MSAVRDTIGPGTYNLPGSLNLSQPKAVEWGKSGTKRGLQINSITPGPGSYDYGKDYLSAGPGKLKRGQGFLRKSKRAQAKEHEAKGHEADEAGKEQRSTRLFIFVAGKGAKEHEAVSMPACAAGLLAKIAVPCIWVAGHVICFIAVTCI